MALNFPSNPSENDIYQFGLLTYIFKNGKWVSQSRGASQLPWYSNMEQARALWKRLAAEAGLNLVDGSFEEGAEITSSSDVVWWQAGSAIYSWHLNEAKTVPVGSTPETSGGIGAGAWVDLTDVTLRSDINTVVKRFASVAHMIADTTLSVGQIVETLSYYGGWAGLSSLPKGGNIYEIVTGGTGTADVGTFINLSNGLQAKGLFTDNLYTIDRFGGVAGDNTKKAVNALAISAALKKFSEIHIPIGRYYSDPIDSDVVNSVTRPSFIGLGTSAAESAKTASIIDCDNGDLYFNGSAADYTYYAENMVFVGGSSYTSRIFGNDTTTTAEHRCRYVNTGFYRCAKGHYSNKYASSSYLEEVVFHSCKYGFYSKSTTSNSRFIKVSLIMCGTGLRAWGYGITINGGQIGYGIPSGSGFGHARGLDIAGKITVNDMYSENYGGDISDCVLMRCAVYDPTKNNIVLNNIELQPIALPYDIECSMEYNNANWVWDSDWLCVNSMSLGKVPTIKLCENDAGTLSTRLFKGVKINYSDGLNYTSQSTNKVAYFNNVDLIVDIKGANTVAYSSQSDNSITVQCFSVDSSNVRYYDKFLNYADTSSSKIFSSGLIFYGTAGRYSLAGDVHMITTLAVGSKYALACRYRDKNNTYRVRIIATGTVLTGNIIDCSFNFPHEVNGGAACLLGFVSSPTDYLCPPIEDINLSTTKIQFNLKRLVGSGTIQA